MAGAIAKTLTGARCKLYINNALAGVFNTSNISVQYDVTPISILGRYNTAELVYTGMGEVSLRLGGFKVVDNGPYEIGSVPQLQELLTHQDITVVVTDRKDGRAIMTVNNVRPSGFDHSTSAKGIVDMNVSMTGLTYMDESGPQEDQGAVNFG